MNKITDEEIIRLNKIKWDSWADNNTLENRSVKFLFFKFKVHFTKYQKLLVDLIDNIQLKTFLDIGCGTGWAVRYAADKSGGTGEFYGLDLSPKMIEKAISNNTDKNNIHFISGDSAQLPFESNFFDTIISTFAFHHFPNPEKSLAEIYRVLKSGGKIYVLDITSDDIITKLYNKIEKKREKEHINIYSTHQYKSMFANANIEYTKRYKLSSWKPVKIHVGVKL